MDERQRAASARRRPSEEGGDAPRTPTSAASHRHRAPARMLGSLLIGAGRRLAGPDALSAALDAARVERGHSPA